MEILSRNGAILCAFKKLQSLSVIFVMNVSWPVDPHKK